ncbi:CCCH-type zinc finger protein with ARM repeat domain-containing protein [Actinidia rufa]|uniref:CCCH-type zinc finger protein with ARM repeat domain-containing protein n=1 Tax=Actinidia rufa TaxID=165716 RepID=A0A7J0EW68_9ERIC|nr:CCCH-type zinc finger protein with ARM repeat domain-containing protein [Actinidia rufa]
MCGGPDRSKSTSSSSSAANEEHKPSTKTMSQLTVDTNDSFSSLLDLAANNDFEGFKQLMEHDVSAIDEVGLWYGRKKGSKQIVLEHRTPLMVAAMYGSVDVLKLILSQPDVDVNRSCGLDKTTALHCAVSSGSVKAVDVVKVLLSAGADRNSMNADGLRPVDMIVVPPKLLGMRASLEELLLNNASDGSVSEHNLWASVRNSSSRSNSTTFSSVNGSPCSPSDLVASTMTTNLNDLSVNGLASNSVLEKKEYPVDPSLPDIKNSIYSTDEFRMFSFKVRPCSRAYSHDWTECPFVHPGENARRRDPRKYHYSCVPCPDFRKGACRRGDMCEYAHGVFECWLHPAQYRTRLCKDGTSCERRVCFFAHTPEELRPLYVSTGSAAPSPRSNATSASVMDMLSLLPSSPSSLMSPSPFIQPMSPSAIGISQSSLAWPQPNVPTLSLPGNNLQSSRLRSSLSARDIPPEDLNMLLDFDAQQQVLNDMSCFSQARSNSVSLNRSCLSKTLSPSNLEELFSAEITTSPRYSDQAAVSGVFSPSHKSAVLSQFQQQSLLSPKNIEHPLLQASLGVSSPRGMLMSPRSVEPLSPMSAQLSAFARREKQQQQLRSLSSHDLGCNTNGSSISPVNSWSKWGSPNGKVDWSVNGAEQGRSSFELNDNGQEPDLSWVQSLVKESPPEMKDNKLAVTVSGIVSSGVALKSNSQVESVDHSVLGAWLEQMQLDQLVA